MTQVGSTVSATWDILKWHSHLFLSPFYYHCTTLQFIHLYLAFPLLHQCWVKSAGRGDSFQSVQAHAGVAASSFLPMYPASHHAQMQQSMAAWGPYLALYQMQAMMATPMSGPPLGGGLGPTPEQVAAQQAQHAFMLAVHQMAHSQSPIAVPQSLGIAMGAAGGAPHGGLSSAAMISNGGVLSQGMALLFSKEDVAEPVALRELS